MLSQAKHVGTEHYSFASGIHVCEFQESCSLSLKSFVKLLLRKYVNRIEDLTLPLLFLQRVKEINFSRFRN